MQKASGCHLLAMADELTWVLPKPLWRLAGGVPDGKRRLGARHGLQHTFLHAGGGCRANKPYAGHWSMRTFDTQVNCHLKPNAFLS